MGRSAKDLWGTLRRRFRELLLGDREEAIPLSSVPLPSFRVGELVALPNSTPEGFVQKYLLQAPADQLKPAFSAVLLSKHSLGLFAAVFWYVFVSEVRHEVSPRYAEGLYKCMAFHYGNLFSAPPAQHDNRKLRFIRQSHFERATLILCAVLPQLQRISRGLLRENSSSHFFDAAGHLQFLFAFVPKHLDGRRGTSTCKEDAHGYCKAATAKTLRSLLSHGTPPSHCSRATMQHVRHLTHLAREQRHRYRSNRAANNRCSLGASTKYPKRHKLFKITHKTSPRTKCAPRWSCDSAPTPIVAQYLRRKKTSSRKKKCQCCAL